MKHQKTLKKGVLFEGVGLHTGKHAKVRVKPAPQNHGIVFSRVDGVLDSPVRIPALSHFVVDTRLSTTIGRGGITIATIEHLMSALWGMGVDNALVEVSGPEIPILDGSSLLFVKSLRKIGLKKQHAHRKYYVIEKPVTVHLDGKVGHLIPHSKEKLSCAIDFDHPVIRKQFFEMTLNPKNYFDKICRARTFGFLKDVNGLKKEGLITGGSLDCAIVLDDEKVLNKDGLRFEDEFVRHKLLDAIGDLALLGFRIKGQVATFRGGHKLHAALLMKALNEKCGYIQDGLDETETQEVLPAFRPLSQPMTA